jgi:hypothetical protein
MTLASIIGKHQAAILAFRTALRAESFSWQDKKFDSIQNDLLEPLIRENERFIDEMTEVDLAARRSLRRLSDSA